MSRMTRRRTSSSGALEPSRPPTAASSSSTERTEANLRWADNTLTTNGEMRVPVGHGHRDVDGAGGRERRRGQPAP